MRRRSAAASARSEVRFAPLFRGHSELRLRLLPFLQPSFRLRFHRQQMPSRRHQHSTAGGRAYARRRRRVALHDTCATCRRPAATLAQDTDS